MASWEQLKIFIRSNYEIAADEGSLVKLLFSTGNDRSQLVTVGHGITPIGAEVAIIASVVAEVGTIDTHALLREMAEYDIGGVALYGDRLAIRHAVPLADLDPGDFVSPLQHVTIMADRIEAKFVGSDVF